jgi:hypothetical protein
MSFFTCVRQIGAAPLLHFAEEREFIADHLAEIAPRRYIPGIVKLPESSGTVGGFPVD